MRSPLRPHRAPTRPPSRSATWPSSPRTCAVRSPTSSCRPERQDDREHDGHRQRPLQGARGSPRRDAMTALRDAIDYTTLGWVKPELDETLRKARSEIEGIDADPSDTSPMRLGGSYLHQVQGRAAERGQGHGVVDEDK